MTHVAAFLAVSAVVIVTPGQDTALTIRNLLLGGRQGVVSNLGNPKMAIFFTSLLPQFASSFAALLALGLVFATMTLTWLTGYAIVVSKAGDVLRRSRIRRALDTVTGAVLVALGLRLAAER